MHIQKKAFTIDRNCWHFIASQITKIKRLVRGDSIYLSSYTGPISSDSSSTETSFTSSLCGGLSCLLPVGTLLACFGACTSRIAKQNRSNICLACRSKQDKYSQNQSWKCHNSQAAANPWHKKEEKNRQRIAYIINKHKHVTHII